MTIEEILQDYRDGKIELDDVLSALRDLPFAELDIAKFDHHRKLRKGYGEVVFCQGKANEHLLKIVQHVKAKGDNIFLTRLSDEQVEYLQQHEPGFSYDHLSRTAFYELIEVKKVSKVAVPVVAAGTADIPVASEAARTLEVMGHDVERIYDVGVAGIHRLYAFMDKLFKARVIIAVAGMEGALPGVIGGLVASPVIALPTSVGYGTSLGGFSAMLTMLNSCSPGVAVVNIDNGFGAGYLAAIINKPFLEVTE